MKYALLNKGLTVLVTDESPWTGTPRLKEFFNEANVKIEYDRVVNLAGSDLKSYAEAEVIAHQITVLTGETYIAFDDGPGTSHQFGCMPLLKIGEDVSYGFNGDYYPCGKIVRITPSLRIIAEKADGSKSVFNRRKQSSRWVKVGGTWSLVKGIHNDRNESF